MLQSLKTMRCCWWWWWWWWWRWWWLTMLQKAYHRSFTLLSGNGYLQTLCSAQAQYHITNYAWTLSLSWSAVHLHSRT